MYELKNNISPRALIDFISIKETNYDLRKKADFVCNNPTTVHYGTESLSTLGPKMK